MTGSSIAPIAGLAMRLADLEHLLADAALNGDERPHDAGQGSPHPAWGGLANPLPKPAPSFWGDSAPAMR